LVLLVMMAVPVFAEVPKLINYSGKLVDKSGNLVPEGEYDMIFILYNGVSGPEVWRENYNTTGNRIYVVNGAFSVVLGSTGNSVPAIFDDLYLEMSFKLYTSSQYDTFPKQKIMSVPYAVRSENANQAESAKTVTTNGAAAILPVGTVLAWLKNMAGTPALPAGFVECNGQTITDNAYKDSPYFNKTLPNLNGEKRFLRGGSVSGVVEADTFQGHWHRIVCGSLQLAIGPDGGGSDDPSSYTFNDTYRSVNGGAANYSIAKTITGDPGYGTPSISGETRPKNMSVVWIIKIK